MKRNANLSRQINHYSRQLLRAIYANIFLNRAGFSLLLAVFTITFWVLVTHSVLASGKGYLLPQDYLGVPSDFIKNFGDSVQEKLNEYFGLLVSFVGLRYVLRAFLG